jgi:hypothetical protein
MNLRCWFGFHEHVLRDRDHAGRQVLRCVSCWRVREYLPVNPDAVAAWRLAQKEQAHRLALKATWRQKV